MAKNEYAKRLNQRKQMEASVIQLWTAQLCMDILGMVLNDPEVMGKDVFGKARLQKVGDAFNRYWADCEPALSTDVTASYVRAKIDERLTAIYGEGFDKWPERYYLWDDKGI